MLAGNPNSVEEERMASVQETRQALATLGESPQNADLVRLGQAALAALSDQNNALRGPGELLDGVGMTGDVARTLLASIVALSKKPAAAPGPGLAIPADGAALLNYLLQDGSAPVTVTRRMFQQLEAAIKAEVDAGNYAKAAQVAMKFHGSRSLKFTDEFMYSGSNDRISLVIHTRDLLEAKGQDPEALGISPRISSGGMMM